MRLELSESGKRFHLIAENNLDKLFIKTMWEEKVSNMKNKDPFAIHLYGHLCDGTDYWSNTPFQLEVSVHKGCASYSGWKPAYENNGEEKEL